MLMHSMPQVYQIRHMIAVAMSVATERLPMEFVDLSLSLPARLKLPLAPPLTLVLSDCTFQPFPISNQQGQHPLATLSGDSLQLRSKGQAQQQIFQQQVSTCNSVRNCYSQCPWQKLLVNAAGKGLRTPMLGNL